MTQFSVSVHEYTSARPGGPAYPHPPPFVFNERQLVIAMVRAILTANPGKPARKLIAAITWPTLRFMLDWSAAPRFELSNVCSLGIRDFSLTSRIGELAQGVSYAYWHWARGYAWIADFAPWAAGSGMAPDFVMFDARTKDLALMEAKGTGSDCYKSPMYKALRQCKAGLKAGPFVRGYGSVLALDWSKNSTGCGTLHIRDPETSGSPSERTAYAVFRRSYASWFELSGDARMAAWCRSVPDDRELYREAPEPYADQSLVTNSVLPSLGFDLRKTRLFIVPAVLEALYSFQIFRQGAWLNELQKISSDKNVMRFPDGTVIAQEESVPPGPRLVVAST